MITWHILQLPLLNSPSWVKGSNAEKRPATTGLLLYNLKPPRIGELCTFFGCTY